MDLEKGALAFPGVRTTKETKGKGGSADVKEAIAEGEKSQNKKKKQALQNSSTSLNR